MSITTETGWSDVAGLQGAKKALREIVVLPFKRPYAFCLHDQLAIFSEIFLKEYVPLQKEYYYLVHQVQGKQ